MLSGGRFSAPTVNDRTYQVIIFSLLYFFSLIYIYPFNSNNKGNHFFPDKQYLL